MASTCVLVLGTPRSGTSCVAGILHHLGLPMGEKLMEADEWNPAGYFQDAEFELWAEAFDLTWGADNERIGDQRAADKIAGLIDARNVKYEKWGLKSNRMVHFIDLLAEKTDLKVIRTKRERAASISSWKARSKQTMAESRRIIKYMNDLIEAALERWPNVPVLPVDFEDCIRDPIVTVGLCADFCGLEARPEAADWVDANLVRFS